MIINSRDRLLELKEEIPFFQENELHLHHQELLDAKHELYKYLNETIDAAGISGPQLGIKLPIFAIKMTNGELEHFIIPKVLAPNKEMYFSTEGCMSLRFENKVMYCLVPRIEEIEVKYFRFNHKNELKKSSKKFCDRYKIPNDGTKLSALLHKDKGRRKNECAIIQHELNHLYGLLILDVAAPLGDRDDKTKKENNKEIYRVQIQENNLFDYLIEDEDITLYYKKNISELKHTEDGLDKSLVALWSDINDEGSETDKPGNGESSSN